MDWLEDIVLLIQRRTELPLFSNPKVSHSFLSRLDPGNTTNDEPHCSVGVFPTVRTNLFGLFGPLVEIETSGPLCPDPSFIVPTSRKSEGKFFPARPDTLANPPLKVCALLSKQPPQQVQSPKSVWDTPSGKVPCSMLGNISEYSMDRIL